MSDRNDMPQVRLGGIALKQALDQGDGSLPSVKSTEYSATARPSRRSVPRATKSLSLPVYVWEALKKFAYETDDSQNVVVMKGLQALGIAIEETDLVDGRSRK